MRASVVERPGVDPCIAVADHFLSLVRLMQRNPERIAALTPIVWDPCTCPNCDGPPLEPKRLFCSELCNQEASFVRYVRTAIANGRTQNSGVKRNGIGTQLIMLANGGYPTQARTIHPKVREEVRLRDGGICQRCGAPGTALDHIKGDDSTAANLQLLCADCNTKKMAAGVVVVTRDSHPEIVAFIENQRRRLAARSVAARFLRICDNEVTWKREWRSHQRCAVEARAESKAY